MTLDKRQYRKFSAIIGGAVGLISTWVGIFLLSDYSFGERLIGIAATSIVIFVVVSGIYARKARMVPVIK
jgi:hypothetical protein